MTIRDLINYKIEYHHILKASIFSRRESIKYCLILNSELKEVFPYKNYYRNYILKRVQERIMKYLKNGTFGRRYEKRN